MRRDHSEEITKMAL